jgi:hypothetical protein
LEETAVGNGYTKLPPRPLGDLSEQQGAKLDFKNRSID